VDSVDTKARYLAYATRYRTFILATSRYLAYTSEVGEAFRPVSHPYLVRACYGVSWAYLGLDVAYEGYKTKKAGHDNTVIAQTVVKRGVFQTLASMALPAFTIHSAVKYSAKVFAKAKNTRVKVWGPVATGLSIVPFLPSIFDHPVEVAVEKAFDYVEEKWEFKKSPSVLHSTIDANKKIE